MKITYQEYENALKIVKKFKQQINSESSFIEDTHIVEKPKKELIDVTIGDFITPLKTNKTNNHCWTIGKKYKVIRVEKIYDYYDKTKEVISQRRLLVQNDQGKINKIKISGSFGYHNYDHFSYNPNPKWACI